MPGATDYPRRLRHHRNLTTYTPRELVNVIQTIGVDGMNMRRVGRFLLLVNRALYDLRKEYPNDHRFQDTWKALRRVLKTLNSRKAYFDDLAEAVLDAYHLPPITSGYYVPAWADDDTTSSEGSVSAGSDV